MRNNLSSKEQFVGMGTDLRNCVSKDQVCVCVCVRARVFVCEHVRVGVCARGHCNIGCLKSHHHAQQLVEQGAIWWDGHRPAQLRI
eukprot:1161500-Pelagomonas_calceolata.AAC.2